MTNYLKPNPDEWHLVLSEMGDEYKYITNSNHERILEVYFNTHITKICKWDKNYMHYIHVTI